MINFQQIVVPVDFRQHTDRLAAFAIDIVEKLGGTITFLNVCERVGEASGAFEVYPAIFIEGNEKLLSEARKKMDDLVEASLTKSPGCKGLILKGDTVDGIVDYVRENNCDLLIMATHGYRGIEKIMLGSVADRVLKRASCPVLLFNPYRGQGK